MAGRPRRGRRDELLGTQTHLPRPTSGALSRRGLPPPRGNARSDRPQTGQPTGTLHARVATRVPIRDPRAAGGRRERRRRQRRPEHRLNRERIRNADPTGAVMINGITLLADDAPKLTEPVASGWHLVLAFLIGIAVIVVLITIVKLHPFLSLMFGALTVGMVAGENLTTVLASFTKGFGETAAGVGILIALGAMFAKLLADSGGADEIVDTIVGHASPRMLPWAMALVGAIIGLPMFFEIGLVLLMPVIYLVSRRSQLSLITVGIPALAGLSAMHGLVPPHPGPLTAIDLLGADLGITLALGVAVAIPTVIVAGPLFGRLAGRWVVIDIPDRFDADDFSRDGGGSVVTAADVA